MTIYLPAVADLPAEQVEQAKEGRTLPRYMLIVDDTPTSLEAALLTFEGEAVEVVTARDGISALQILKQQPELEALLSDIMMPGMSGIELAEAARRIRPDLKIVLMTGYSDKLEQGQIVDFPVVNKPFARQEVELAFRRTKQPRLDNVLPLFGKET